MNALQWLWKIPLLIVAFPVAFVAGFFARPVSRTPPEVAKYLRDFIEGTGGQWDWDDFTSVAIKDPELERIRREAAEVDLPLTDFTRLHELFRDAEALESR